MVAQRPEAQFSARYSVVLVGVLAPLAGLHVDFERSLVVRSQVGAEENSCHSLRISRPTPIMTTGPSFVGQIDSEGVMSMRLIT
jgi:hypothetical protein